VGIDTRSNVEVHHLPNVPVSNADLVLMIVSPFDDFTIHNRIFSAYGILRQSPAITFYAQMAERVDDSTKAIGIVVKRGLGEMAAQRLRRLIRCPAIGPGAGTRGIDQPEGRRRPSLP
jgi:hypothetical protein